MGTVIFEGLVEPTDEELQRPLDVVMGGNLRRTPEAPSSGGPEGAEEDPGEGMCEEAENG